MIGSLGQQKQGRDAYRNIAPLYDGVTAKFLHDPRLRILEILHKYNSKSILDVGCGTGVLLGKLRSHGFVCTGIDYSAAMLGLADKMLNQNPAVRGAGQGLLAEPVRLMQCNAAELSFQNKSFDASVCSLLLHESDIQPEDILQEALRVSRQVIVLDWRMSERNLDYLFTFWVHGIERLAGKRHYANFRIFMRKGGLRGLAERTGCNILEEQVLKMGALSLMVLSNG